MKTYKNILRQIEDKVYCDICGSNCTDDNCGSEYATVEASWGYCSSRDGQSFDIHICDRCFGELIQWMITKRTIYLNCFEYPHNKDPLLGNS